MAATKSPQPDSPPSLAHYESLIDYANRRSLRPYDNGKRLWVLVLDDLLSLAEVARAFEHTDEQEVRAWVQRGAIRILPSFKLIPGEDFYCIYFVDAYFLKGRPDKLRLK
jgi:hypothetical protein